MRSGRQLLNHALRVLLTGNNPRARDIDRFVFRQLSFWGRLLGVADAAPLGEEWTLDAADILYRSILQTPYGQPLEFVSPLLATLEVTNNCHRGCSTCYADSVPRLKQASNISPSLIEMLSTTKIPAFLLTGGEPSEHPDIAEIVDILLSRGRKVTIATSSFHRNLVPVAKRYPKKLTALFSFWGNQDTHDANRGRGSFSSTIRMIRALEPEPVVCSVNFVVTGTNLEPLEGLREVIESLPHLRRVYVTREIHVGRSRHKRTLNEDLPARIREAASTIESETGRHVHLSLPRPPAISAKEMHFGQRIAAFLFGLVPPAGCGAANWSCHILSDGAIAPCFANAALRIDASDGDLERAWNALRALTVNLRGTVECMAEIQSKSMHPLVEIR